MATLAVIPARGSSRELRRKNLLPDANGVPLVLASARAARDAGCHVVISTDDEEVKSLALIDGFGLHHRGPELAETPVDEVVRAAADSLVERVTEVAGAGTVTYNKSYDGPVLLVQPTVQPITPEILKSFLHQAEGHGQIGTRDKSPAVMGVEDRHISWFDGGPITDRRQRQEPGVWPVRELGVRWWPTSEIVAPQRVITVPWPLTDIDTAADYQQIRRRLRIGFIVTTSPEVGRGHFYRTLTLAEKLQRHDVTIDLDAPDRWGAEMLKERGWPQFSGPEPDVWVYDTLDTLTHYRGPQYPAVVTLEDRGGKGATAVINAMYGHGDYVGAKYAVLRPEFTVGNYQVREEAKRVLVVFGGTDPAKLHELVQQSLTPIGAPNVGPEGVYYDFIRPGEKKRSVGIAMHDADLLITSGGRTVFEAAAVGIPTIVMCQNQRETTHTHLGVGNINLGLGKLVTPDQLRHTVSSVLEDYPVRLDMSETAQASIDGHGADRVASIIEYVGLYGEKP